MRFPPSFLEDIKARLPISEIVGARVQFDSKKSNAPRGDYWACCPFHGEKTPSFHCDNRQGRYYCFGCGASGDIFRFLVELDGLSFSEAVERLAGQAGLSIPKFDEQAEKQEQQRTTLYDMMERAACFYEDCLWHDSSAAASAARAYLRGRGISAAIQKQFRIGYAPLDGAMLQKALQGDGVAVELMVQAGLVVPRERDATFYGRFRDRIMFPILDIGGRVIAFGGRALSAQSAAKYLNSPETELFHKGHILYHLAGARQAASRSHNVREGGQSLRNKTTKPLIVVEGYMDVVALEQAGFHTAVAPLGTALTEEQLLLLWRICPQPVLCFDGDKAGITAAYRALDKALPLLKPGMSVQFALMPDGQDPDDIIRTEGGDAFAAILAQSAPLIDILWRRETEGQRFSTPENRAALEKRLFETVSVIRDTSLRSYYLQDIKQRLWQYFRQGQNQKHSWDKNKARIGNSFNRDGFGKKSVDGLVTESLIHSPFVRAAGRQKGGFTPRDATILALLLAHPALWHENCDILSELEFPSAELTVFYRAMMESLAELAAAPDEPPAFIAEAEAEALTARLVAKGQKAILDKITAFTANLGVKAAQRGASLAEARPILQQALALSRRARSLSAQMREIETDLREKADSRDVARLLALRHELSCMDSLFAADENSLD